MEEYNFISIARHSKYFYNHFQILKMFLESDFFNIYQIIGLRICLVV